MQQGLPAVLKINKSSQRRGIFSDRVIVNLKQGLPVYRAIQYNNTVINIVGNKIFISLALIQGPFIYVHIPFYIFPQFVFVQITGDRKSDIVCKKDL